MSRPTIMDAYVRAAGGDGDDINVQFRAAALMAQDLMRGDPRTFKAGYTLPNAVLAAAEAFGGLAEYGIYAQLDRLGMPEEPAEGETIPVHPRVVFEMLVGSYTATHFPVTEDELAGLAKAVEDRANKDSVIAAVAIEVAISDGALTWPEAMRRSALATYGLRAPTTEAPVEAIRAIVNYNYTDEEHDFDECVPGAGDADHNGQEGHIYLALQEVRLWLDSLSS